jgi:hypothetical protein
MGRYINVNNDTLMHTAVFMPSTIRLPSLDRLDSVETESKEARR